MISNIKERALKNISYSLISFIWPVIIAFVVTPIIVHHFGVKEYGIYIFISTLISLTGLLDVGFSTALSKFISEYHGSKNKEAMKSLFKTANTILFIIGVVGAICIISSIFIGLSFFPSELIDSYQIYIPAFIYAGALFLITSMNSLHVIVPTSYQRFDLMSKLGIPMITIQQLGILAVVFLNLSVNTLFLVQLIIAVLAYFVYRKYTIDILDDESKSFLGVYGWDKKEAVKCYKFGVISFLNNIAGSSLTYLDRMIIPLFLGPSNLTYYSLPGSITNKIPSLSGTLSSVVFPMTSYFEGEGNKDMVKNLYIRSMRLITIISASTAITFIVFAYPMLNFWISEDVAINGYKVLIILSITSLILAITGPLSSFLLGMGKLKVLSITSAITAIINIILLLILLPRYGILGAAFAYLLALIPYIYLLYITEYSYLELTFRRAHYLKLIRQLIATSFVVYIIDFYFIKQFIVNFPLVIIAIIFSSAMFIYIHYLFGFFEKEDAHDIINFLRQVVISTKSRFKLK